MAHFALFDRHISDKSWPCNKGPRKHASFALLTDTPKTKIGFTVFFHTLEEEELILHCLTDTPWTNHGHVTKAQRNHGPYNNGQIIRCYKRWPIYTEMGIHTEMGIYIYIYVDMFYIPED